MFRHNDISDGHKPVALAGLFENREEAVARARGIQKRQAPVAGESDEVQMMSAVGAMQADGHDKQYPTSSIVPALAKNARTGHPEFRNGKGERRRLGHPPTASATATLGSASSTATGDQQILAGTGPSAGSYQAEISGAVTSTSSGGTFTIRGKANGGGGSPTMTINFASCVMQ
jgi:hypothetical protein